MPILNIYDNSGKKSQIIANKSTNLYKLLLENSFHIEGQCNGKSICGKCKVMIKNAHVSVSSTERQLLSDDEIKRGIRLSCMINIEDDMDIILLDGKDKNASILNSLYRNDFIVDGDIIIKKVKFKEPTLQNQQDYFSLLKGELGNGCKRILPKSLNKLFELKDADFFCVLYKNEILDIRKDDFIFGIGIDIGTTTVVAYFANLLTGEIIDTYAFMNPQKRFGADVISRIDFTIENKDGLEILQKEILESINNAIKNVSSKNGFKEDDIYKIVFVGNTTMLHLLLGVSPKSIATAPFSPVFTDKIELKAKDLGLDVNKNAIIKLLDGISSYVGADIVSGIVTTELHKDDRISLLLDIGTNGEMVLGNKDFLLACSTAAGPAFEGVNLSCGMSAVEGAIDRVIIKNGRVEFSTIGDKKAKGICGSGVIQAISNMLDEGIIDSTGRFDEDGMKGYEEFFRMVNNQPAFFITDDVYITQKDIREIQLAKSAIASGIKTMLKKANISINDISVVYLAGGFGNYIDPYSAVKIGLIDSKVIDRIKPVGNSAGNGAILALLNKEKEKEFELLKSKVRYIELSNSPEFNELFVENMMF